MIITLLTDFGTRDWFVPSMKGVILDIAPSVQIVDLTHEIPAQDIRAGAFVLAAAMMAFPKGSIHVAVVDPGVGSRRKPIAVRTSNSLFIGPDNGLLSLAAQREKAVEIRALENERFFRHPVSHTFHGRDVFAPIAGHLARGVRFSKLGPKLKSMRTIQIPEPVKTGKSIRGEVVYVDHFGNLITNIRAELLSGNITIQLAGHRMGGLSRSYSQSGRREPVAVVNSLNLVEIGIRDGNASKVSKVRIGAAVLIHTV